MTGDKMSATQMASMLGPAKRKKKSRKKKSRAGSTSSRSIVLSTARENAQELASIHAIDEIEIDYRQTLSIKRGDLHIIQGEFFRCSPNAPTLAHIPLILKRLDCVDRRTYDLKVYEADTFLRFRGHPNIISLYSYWSETNPSPYVYKTLVLLYEEGVGTDLKTTIVDHKDRITGYQPSLRQMMRCICDLAKGLIALHNCKLIHGRVKPSSIYLSHKRTCMLSELGKVELDSARHTHHFFSKLLIGEAIPRVLVYWAPELLRLEQYGTPVDMWALGVTIYEVLCGEHPFPVHDEMAFREAVLSGAVDFTKVNAHAEVEEIIRNLIRVDPQDRWTAHEVLAFAQAGFAVHIQRQWRGYKTRVRMEFEKQCITALQAQYRAMARRKRYLEERRIRRECASITIQSRLRSHFARQSYRSVRLALMRCQANVLTRQQTKNYRQMRSSVHQAQVLMRTYLASKWFLTVQQKRRNLETRCRDMQLMMERYEREAADFTQCFPDSRIPLKMRHLESFDSYELAIGVDADVQDPNGSVDANDGAAGADSTTRRSKLKQTMAKCDRLEAELEEVKGQLRQSESELTELREEEANLKEVLGVKHKEFKPAVERMKARFAKCAQMCEDSVELQIGLARKYTYSNWDMVHEPENIADNVLSEGSSQWKTLSPSVDLLLEGGARCFIARIEVCSGDCGPSKLVLHQSRNGDEWVPHAEFSCNAAPGDWQSFVVPGEVVCSYLRLSMPQNVRGGSYVSVQQVRVFGICHEVGEGNRMHRNNGPPRSVRASRSASALGSGNDDGATTGGKQPTRPTSARRHNNRSFNLLDRSVRTIRK